jgi:pimeloyl-ACP methyl ester carboxylesterase
MPSRFTRSSRTPAIRSGLRGAILSLVFVIVAAVGVVGGYHFERDLAAARARVAAGSRIAQTACGPIEYGEAGSGPPVLLIHGAGGGFDQGLELGAPLVAAGYRVIAPSRFGYLRTPLPADASPASQADAHACLLDALHVDKAVVLGGSAGAPSALRLCLRHGERCRALVLVSPMTWAPPLPGSPAAPPNAIVAAVTKALVQSDLAFWSLGRLSRDTMLRLILATPPADFRAAPPAEQARALALLRHILPVAPRAAGLWFDSTIQPRLQRPALERLAVPTLVIAVEDDLFGFYPGARYTAGHIPGARFVGYATGGHLWLGHQDALWGEVLRFLAALPR